MTDEPAGEEKVVPEEVEEETPVSNGSKETTEATDMVTDDKPSTDISKNAASATEAEAAKDAAGAADEEVKDDVKKEDEKEGTNQKRARQKREKVFVPPPVSLRPQRQRKSLERFAVEDSRDKADEDIKPGKGVPLKDIPSIAANLGRLTRNDEIVGMLYTILFGKRGKAQTLKKNILEFSGYPWKEENEAKERAKVKEKLERFTREGLQQMLDLLDLPKGGRKNEQAERILDFLEKPIKEGHLSPTPKPAGAGRKRAARDEEDDDDDDDDYEDEDEKPVKKKARTPKPKSPAGKKGKAPLRDSSLKEVVRQLLSEGTDDKKLTLDEVTEALGEHFAGNLQRKADLIKQLYDEFAGDKVGDVVMPDAPEGEKDAETKVEAEAATSATASETLDTEKPVAETPVAETPVAETPVAETPVAETPVVETPVAETPVAETPVAETPVAETPGAEMPVADLAVVPSASASTGTALPPEAAAAVAAAATAAAVADTVLTETVPISETPSESAAALPGAAPADTEITNLPRGAAAAASALAAEEEKADTATTVVADTIEVVTAETMAPEVPAAAEADSGKGPMEVDAKKEAVDAEKETATEVAPAENAAEAAPEVAPTDAAEAAPTEATTAAAAAAAAAEAAAVEPAAAAV